MGFLDFFTGKPKHSMEPWPFADAPNTAVFTNRYVMRGELITAVYHDLDDGSWQFHTDDHDTNSNTVMMLVALSQVANVDPTILELANLPVGHRATRSSLGMTWVIEKHMSSDED